MTLIYSHRNQLNLAHFQFSIINPSNLARKNNFGLEIDRIFVCVEQGTTAVCILQELGLSCSSQILKSKSQGTLSKIFFFENMCLEIIWSAQSNFKCDYIVPDRPEGGLLKFNHSRNRLQTAINFAARYDWQQTKASPFGIGVSKKLGNYQKLNVCQDIVYDLIIDNHIYYTQQNQKNILEPFLFLVSDHLKIQPNQNYLNQLSITTHPLGVRKITDLKITLERGRRRASRLLSLLKNNNLLAIDYGLQPLLELTFDSGLQGEILDARPILPMILKY